jgi:hypothetical protein
MDFEFAGERNKFKWLFLSIELFKEVKRIYSCGREFDCEKKVK